MAVFIRQLLSSLIRELENDNGRSDHLVNAVAYCIDWLYSSLVGYLGVNNPIISDELVSLVRDAKDCLDVIVQENVASHSYRVEQVSHGSRGRPKFIVARDQLEFFLERGFSVPNIAQLVGLSLNGVCSHHVKFKLFARESRSASSSVITKTVEVYLKLCYQNRW